MSAAISNAMATSPSHFFAEQELDTCKVERFNKWDDACPSLETAEFTLQDAHLSNGYLVVETLYGGNTKADFQVYVDEQQLEKFPPVTRLHIVRNDTGDARESARIHRFRISLDDGLFSAPCSIQVHIGNELAKSVQRN